MSHVLIGRLDDANKKVIETLEGNLKELRDTALASQDIVDEVKTLCTDAVTNAPKQPGYTCPDIDAIIRVLLDVGKTVRSAEKTLDSADLAHDFRQYGEYELDQCIGKLEDLRRANDQLRDYGNHYQDAVEKINEEVTV